MKQLPHTTKSGQPAHDGAAIRTGYYHGDMPGRTEPYLVTIDTQSHAVDFR